MSEDKRPSCTAENKAPKGTGRYLRGVDKWDWTFQHPEAVGVCINDDHDDWLYQCPHCGCGWIYEGPDA